MRKRKHYDWDNKEQLVKDLSESYSMSDFLIRQKFAKSAGSQKTFKEKIKLHNIDISNIFSRRLFIPKSKLEKKNFPIKSDIFCINSVFSRSFVKNYNKTYNVIPYVCNVCGNNGVWQGKPLTLELEHKNGISDDNRIENLEYLCLNCHSQTSTYRAKNTHIKLFNKRINDLLFIKKIDDKAILALASLWNIRVVSVIDWIQTYADKISSYSIDLCFEKRTFLKKDEIINAVLEHAYKENNSLSEISRSLDLSHTEALKLIRSFHRKLYERIGDKRLENTKNIENSYISKIKELDSTNPQNYLQILTNLWEMSENEVILWIKKNCYEYYTKILKFENEQSLIQKNNGTILREVKRVVGEESRHPRFADLSLIKTKKEVLTLAKKWNTSVNGAKKWIRNNMPDKFAEIYDDKHLVKNQQKNVSDEKINYIKSLTIDFDQEEAMAVLKVNKPGLFSLLRKHNPSIIEALHSKYPCPRCNSNTRTNGEYQRCISCNHNFKIS